MKQRQTEPSELPALRLAAASARFTSSIVTLPHGQGDNRTCEARGCSREPQGRELRGLREGAPDFVKLPNEMPKARQPRFTSSSTVWARGKTLTSPEDPALDQSSILAQKPYVVLFVGSNSILALSLDPSHLVARSLALLDSKAEAAARPSIRGFWDTKTCL